ncbi:hypothetical protein ACJJTC_015588 [Scirpophaga incertulas]
MLEYIRRKCGFASFTQFDLCDESGALMGLFNLPTYAYATAQFEHKKIYYIVVLRTESDRRLSVLPQLNRENKLYEELRIRVKHFLVKCDTSSEGTLIGKVTPPSVTGRTTAKKK